MTKMVLTKQEDGGYELKFLNLTLSGSAEEFRELASELRECPSGRPLPIDVTWNSLSCVLGGTFYLAPQEREDLAACICAGTGQYCCECGAETQPGELICDHCALGIAAEESWAEENEQTRRLLSILPEGTYSAEKFAEYLE